jgi:hypothetical protein
MKKRKHKEETLIDRLRKKYADHLCKEEKGIFTQRIRQQLLGRKPKYENTFWYRIRNDVQLSLTDLALFIETAEEEVNKVITSRSLKPIVDSLLGSPQVSPEKPSREKAEIAKLFITKGFEYLQSKGGLIPDLCVRTINDALDSTNLLVETFNGEDNK